MDYKPATHRPVLKQLGRASRRFFKMFWSTMCSYHRPEQAKFTPSTPSASPRGPTRAPSPYNGISYNRVSSLMDVDYFRGSINADGVSQSGYLAMLRVVNPDLSSRSNSELSGTMIAARVNTPPMEATNPPCLPDLYFVSSPEPSLSCVMALSYDILTNVLREGAIPLPARRSASSFDRSESPPNDTYSQSSLGESPVPSIARIFTWNTVPRELVFTPLGPRLDCQRPVNSRSNRSSDRLTSTTGTSLSSEGRSTLFPSSIESLIDLLDRFNRQWSTTVRPRSDRTSKGTSRISAASLEVSQNSRKLSCSWGLFLSVDSLPTMPIVLAAANVAQKRRLHRRLVRRVLS